MRKKLAVIAAFLMLVFCAAFAACGSGKRDPASDPVFKLDKTKIELTSDGTAEILTLTIANVDETPVWTSSKPEVATVTVGSTANKATVRGMSEGTAVITATTSEQIAVCTVTVRQGQYLNLVTKRLDLLVGTTGAVVVDTNITTAITYTSSDPAIASVTSEGVVTGISAGSAFVTVSGGGKSVNCPVTVIAPYIELDEEELILVAGDTHQLTAIANGAVEWETADSGVATVDQTGLVTAVAKGETTITASYGTAQATCSVKVKGELITVTLSEREKRLEPGESFLLTATLTPAQQDDAVLWSVTEGEDIVSVDSEGKVTSLGKYGVATVRATCAADPDAYAECIVTVPAPYSDWLEIKDKASLAAALTAGNEGKNMYLSADIDLAGETIGSNIGYFRGIFDGRGHKISNFTCGNLFGAIAAEGVVRNLAITCNAANLGSNMGIFGLEMHGTVENCRLDVTFGSAMWLSVFGRNGRGTVRNTIVLVRNPANAQNAYAGFVQGGGTWENVYYAVYGGAVSGNGPALKTDAQLKESALYADWDETVWQIAEGEIPELKS